MTTFTPLVIDGGQVQQLPSGSALGGITGGTATGEAMTQDQFGTNYDELGPTGSPDFNFVECDDLTVTNAATIQGVAFGAGLGGVSGCIGIGAAALGTNVSGTRNLAVGNTALEYLTTGIDNVALGGGAGESLVGGGHNVLIGVDAARLVNAGTDATAITESVVIGDAARVSGSSDTNTIVIGSDGRGEGSNTTVIGNSSTTDCHLYGELTADLGSCTNLPLASGVDGILPLANGGIGIDASAVTDGQLLIGKTSDHTLNRATLTGTSNQVNVTNGAGSITLSTPQSIATTSTPQFARMGVGVAASGAAAALLCIGGNPTTVSSSNYAAVFDSGSGGLVCVGKDATNYGYLRFIGSGPYSDFSTVEGGTSYANSFVVKGGCLAIGATTLPSGATRNLILGGGSTSPMLGAATADMVSEAGVDNGAGNREKQIQPEAGGFFAFGNNKFRRVPTANQDIYHWTPTVNTTDGTQTTLATIPIVAGRTYLIEARVVMRRTGGSAGTADDGGSYVRRGTYTTKSSTVTLMGSVETIGTDAEDQAGTDMTFTISGTNVLARVTGATNNNMVWFGDITVQSVAS